MRFFTAEVAETTEKDRVTTETEACEGLTPLRGEDPEVFSVALR